MKLKKTIATILSITMILCLTGCGSKKKEEAIDAFNKTSSVFDETTELINENLDILDEETISVYQSMSSLLTDYKELLEGDSKISDEKYDEMIEWFTTTERTLKEAKEEIEAALSSATE